MYLSMKKSNWKIILMMIFLQDILVRHVITYPLAYVILYRRLSDRLQTLSNINIMIVPIIF